MATSPGFTASCIASPLLVLGSESDYPFILRTDNIDMISTVVPVMNGHPRDQAKVSVHCRWPLIRGNFALKCVGRGFDNVAVQGRWPLIRGNFALKCVGRGFDNVAVQGRWPLTTGVAQGRYYCNIKSASGDPC